MESGAYTAGGDQYPVQFSVEYPDRDLNRLTTAFRIIVAIPIVIVLAAIGGNDWSGGWGGEHGAVAQMHVPIVRPADGDAVGHGRLFGR